LTLFTTPNYNFCLEEGVKAAGDQTSILQMKLFRFPLSEDHVQRTHLFKQLQQVKRHPLTVINPQPEFRPIWRNAYSP
jgi:hypothetical protein